MSYRQKQSDIAAETEMWERNKHSNNCNVRIATETTEVDCNCGRRYKLEPPADISGITMQVSEQRLGRIQTRTFDASEPPPDMSDYKMETISDGGAWAMIIGIPLLGLMIAGLIYLFVLMW